ncbi:hypothetical protein L1987_62651 [Smallanthus sonchifolius]|uniref:Uncharacterized protein n=1 Tax=Smallanthus sonchifolius TaxID=185202 RepID=A0ACB9CB90_9ASTR|nr:hypothetical protein L1987_62651 [Smallanthus sonchifolius]
MPPWLTIHEPTIPLNREVAWTSRATAVTHPNCTTVNEPQRTRKSTKSLSLELSNSRCQRGEILQIDSNSGFS